ncbi:MAG: hypothetical protein J6B26_01175 [Agathobacter sp.]|nr:hypothetical protein [Agathobacter sp.]
MKEMSDRGSIYDDVFHTLLNDCSELIIPVINEVFGERYSGKEQIEFTPNEHYMNTQGGHTEKRITDASFQILGSPGKKYHWECQSTKDDSMLVRFFEYDTQIALDQGKIKDYVLTVEFPHSAVLFLRCDENTPDQMKIEMKTPGGDVSYDIPVMKSQNYSLDEIFEKKLLFLIPFHIFSHESQFKVYNTDEESMYELLQEYLYISEQLDVMAEVGEISEYARCTMLDLSNRVIEQIAKNYDNVREGVKKVMAGHILEYEAKTILNQGIAQGIAQGIDLGKKEEALNNARNFFLDGVKFETVRKNIQSLTEEELTEVYAEVQGMRIQLRGKQEKSVEQKMQKQPMKKDPKL